VEGPKSSDNEGLRQSLTRLHAALAGRPELDGRLRQLLHEVVADIERLLGPKDTSTVAAGQSPVPTPAPPRSRLEALVATFDAEHPTLSASVRELVDLLGRAGL
jgi:hypothetical protein